MWKCKTCEALKVENEYLKKLIDSLLEKSNVRPVVHDPYMQSPEETQHALDEAEKIANGELMKFGGD